MQATCQRPTNVVTVKAVHGDCKQHAITRCTSTKISNAREPTAQDQPQSLLLLFLNNVGRRGKFARGRVLPKPRMSTWLPVEPHRLAVWCEHQSSKCECKVRLPELSLAQCLDGLICDFIAWEGTFPLLPSFFPCVHACI